MRTAPGASDAARKACGESCGEVEQFMNSCGAIAEARDETRAFGMGDTRAMAEAQALEACKADRPGCAIRVWACSK